MINLASKVSRVIVPGNKNYSYSDGDQWYQWSPDSKWFTVNFLHEEQWIGQVGLVSAEGGKDIIDLTKSGYGGDVPQWGMDGRELILIRERHGLEHQAS